MMDLTGTKYGRLVVLSEAPKRGSALRYWNCKCSCGNVVTVCQGDLRRNPNKTGVPTRSCGCIRKEKLIKRITTHGQHGTPTYRKWRQMYIRVSTAYKDPENSCYRGISICKRWRKFQNFLDDMGEVPEGLTLERINSKKGYSPSNCKWATWAEQCNNRSNVHLLTFLGKTQSMKAWSDELGIGYSTLHGRIKTRGWPVDRALSTPVKPSYPITSSLLDK